jgi:EPS-associated MarR family transcriptional regulator
MTNDNDSLQILRYLNKVPSSSQRSIAKNLGFSLGKINYTLKALRQKGYVKISNFKRNKKKRNYLYILTPNGIFLKSKLAYKFMKIKFKEYEELKKEINE